MRIEEGVIMFQQMTTSPLAHNFASTLYTTLSTCGTHAGNEPNTLWNERTNERTFFSTEVR
jgi:hypothetical protein